MTYDKIHHRVLPSQLLLLLLSKSLSLILFIDASSSARVLPQIESYARVSTNRDQPVAVTDRKNLTYRPTSNQARSFHDIAISRSPVYVPTGVEKLRNGEAIDHTSTKTHPTLELEAFKLQTDDPRKQAQKRFHPPASFEHSIAHSNAARLKFESAGKPSSDLNEAKFPVPSYATLPKDVYSQPSSSDPSAGDGDDYSPDAGDSFSKIPDSYAQPETYGSDNLDDSPKFSGFPLSSSYEDKQPTKPDDFSIHYERPSHVDTSYVSLHDYNHDFIYDHPPDDYFHHHTKLTTTTTEEPEVNDQRLSKRPYSYYYIGKKLWYLPLYFSIYFIIYIAALVLKSITRHKINFPAHLAAAAGDARTIDDPYEGPGWYDLTKRVLDGIDLYNGIGKSRDT